jgi:pimeloyl-ACP methyl ester carboxylesterase
VVLVPGLMCDEALYEEQVAALADLAELVVSDVSRGASIAEMAGAVLDVAPERFCLLGLSMGGYVVFEVLRQARERADAVALLDTSARLETSQQTARRRELIALGQEQGFAAVLEDLWPAEVAPSRLGDGALRQRFDAMAGRFGLDVFVRQQEAIMARVDSRPELRRIQCPTLVLCGRDDVITPVDGHEEMAAEIPGARLVVLDDCGHLSTWEQPEAVTAEMRRWLGG